MRKTLLMAAALLSVATVPSLAESPYIYGWHFWRDGANIDCGNGKGSWVTGLDYSTNFQPDLDKFRRIADEGHTIIMRIDWDSQNRFPTNPADYAKFAARYAFWVDKLKDYCHIWLIGNEEPMNYECFREVRKAVHAIQPEAIFCAGAPHYETQCVQALGDYLDGMAAHTYSTSFIDAMNAATPAGKTKLAYITEFQSAPPNTNPSDLRNAFYAFSNYNQTHGHKLECACKFVYYEFGSEYSSLQMQPMQNADFNEATSTTAFTNSYAQPYIAISNIAATGTSNSTAQITWDTDVGSTGQIEYWEAGEVAQHWSDFSGDENVTAHTAEIGSLTPGHTYHYIIKSWRGHRPLTISGVQTYVHEPPNSGTITGYVRTHGGAPVHGAGVTRTPGNYTFTTGPDGSFVIAGCPQGSYSLSCSSPGTSTGTSWGSFEVSAGQTSTVNLAVTPKVNYLTNASFESGLGGWTSFGNAPSAYTGPWFGDIGARSGSTFIGIANNWGTPKGGVYQRRTGLTSGTYNAAVWANQYHGDNPYTETRDRLGIDPTGGTDPNSASVRWSEWNYNFWHWRSEWKQLVSPSVTVSGGACTVFVQYDDQSLYGWHIHAFDDAALVGAALETQVVSSPAAAKAIENGSPVQLNGMIATTDRSALGTDVLYIEDPDRTSGIRVAMTGIATAVSEGDTVNVIGVMRGADEPYIEATSVSASAGAPLEPLGLVNGSVGGGPTQYQLGVKGGVGVNNLGVLVRTTGRVLTTQAGRLEITDGSDPIHPLRIDVSHISNTPAVGDYVAVTGIASIEHLSGLPVLLVRKSADVQVTTPQLRDREQRTD